MAAEYLDWRGSAKIYRYWFLSNPSNGMGIPPVAGNYIFVKNTLLGWVPLYVGIADNLSARIPQHERWPEAVKLGATHVVVHTNTNKFAREAEERDLIASLNPPMNTQHRSRATLLSGQLRGF